MKKINIIVTKKQMSHIIQSLLFASTPDVTANWDKKDYKNFVKTAKHVSKFISDMEKIDLSAIAIDKNNIYEEPKLVKKIIKTFDIGR